MKNQSVLQRPQHVRYVDIYVLRGRIRLAAKSSVHVRKQSIHLYDVDTFLTEPTVLAVVPPGPLFGL